MRSIKAFFLLSLLAACGNTGSNAIFDLGRAQIKAGASQTASVSLAQQRADAVAKVRAAPGNAPVLMVELPDRKVVATMVVGQVNAGNASWFDLTGASVVTRKGVARATRGLGADLMSSDVSGTLRALQGGATQYTRFHRYLNGAGQPMDYTLTCSMVRRSGTFEETCAANDVVITNTYELNGGSVMRSRQWIGPDVGYANLTRLR